MAKKYNPSIILQNIHSRKKKSVAHDFVNQRSNKTVIRTFIFNLIRASNTRCRTHIAERCPKLVDKSVEKHSIAVQMLSNFFIEFTPVEVNIFLSVLMNSIKRISKFKKSSKYCIHLADASFVEELPSPTDTLRVVDFTEVAISTQRPAFISSSTVTVPRSLTVMVSGEL